MEEKKMYSYEYPRPAVTTDCVLFGFDNDELKVLLINRNIDPYKGMWALPGGFMSIDENADDCAKRVLNKETGLKDIYMEQLYTFTDVNRDPRYRVISIAYYALVKLSDYEAKAGADESDAQWFKLSEVPSLAFDHQQILQAAQERLKGKIKYQPVGFELLPEKFTLPELHQLYETILQTSLDRRNFRKKMLSYDFLIDLSEVKKVTRSRAPKFYRFDKEKYDELTKNGVFFEFKSDC